jgi:hypothetical protein
MITGSSSRGESKRLVDRGGVEVVSSVLLFQELK